MTCPDETTSLRLLRAGLTLLVCALGAWPWVAFSLRHYLPGIDNDEIAYFLQIKAFMLQGFHGGYFSYNDRIPASSIHFGVHGPALVTIYGTLATLIGWQNSSPYIINLLFLFGSLAVLSLSLRGDAIRHVACAVFILLHGHVVLFLPAMMQESFHISLAVLMAAVWKLALDRGSIPLSAVLIGLVVLATFTRYAWGCILPIVLFSVLRRRIPPRFGGWAADAGLGALAAGAGMALTYLVMWLWWFWGAPAGGTFTDRLGALLSLAARAGRNTQAWFRPGLDVFAEYPLYFRLSIAASLVIVGLVAVRARFRQAREAGVYALLLLAVPLSVQVLFYVIDGFRDVRVLAAFHTLAGLMFLSQVGIDRQRVAEFTRRRATAIAAAIVALLIVNATVTYRAARSSYGMNWARAQAIRVDEAGQRAFGAMSAHLRVRDDDTAFCKTLYVPPAAYYDPRLIHLPYGFGVSVVTPSGPATLPTLRGKYAILGTAPSEVAHAFDASPDWGKVGTFEDFQLYRSRRSCRE